MSSLKKIDTLENVNLEKLCTIKIGGIGKHIFFPKTEEEFKIIQSQSLDKDKKLILLGIGSNTIFKDGKLDYFFISTRKFKYIKYWEKGDYFYIHTSAGVSFKEITSIVKEKNLEGFENLAGIPATIGGAISMNAGAFNTEIFDIVEKVYWLNRHNEIIESKKEDILYGYRYTQFQQEGIVLSAILKLKKTNKPISKIIKQIIINRNKKQPVNIHTCGSTYKNPKQYPAGFLLEQSGLKGYKIKEIAFSNKHANFLVNLGKATYSDLIKLLEYAENLVNSNFGIKLQREVKIVE
ncbi:MAG: UDP-N-acetylmuramate dehydrogenase [Aquificae bacterium]|nr:UDP-N-acetylmuramate dehydrogenase [Aquificota bacterium]